MEIKKCLTRISCDIEGCNNISEYTFKVKRLFNRETNICSNCLKEMQQLFNVVNPPKSPVNMLNKKGEKNEKTKKQRTHI